MATTDFSNGVTLSDAAWFDDTDISTYSYLTSVAGTNTITATGPAPLALATGQHFKFIPAATNTGATTLNITPSGGAALGATNVFAYGAACAGGELVINVPVMVIYDGTQFNIVGPSGVFGAGSAAAPSIARSGDSNTGFWFPGADILAASTGGTERWRTTLAGFCKASNTGTYQGITSSYHEHNSNAADYVTRFRNTHATTPYGIDIWFSAASPDNNTEQFFVGEDSTTPRIIIYSDGDLQNHDNSYGGISDERLKQDITDAGSQVDDFRRYRFRKYRFKTDVQAYGDKAVAHIGLIAQEVLEVSPGLVREDKDGFYSLQYSVLAVKAAKAVQELIAIADDHEARLAKLEGL